MSYLRVQVPASAANLGPGFDCLAMALSLHNTFTVQLAATGVVVENAGPGADAIPSDGSNLMVESFYHLADRVGAGRPGISVRAEIQIPPSSGLGSSTSAVLAGLLAADHLLKAGLPRHEILSLAGEIEGHADNAAAALFGGLSLVNHHGSNWRSRRLPLAPQQIIMVIPETTITTRQMREAMPENIALAQAVDNAAALADLIAALRTGDFTGIRRAARVSFHQEARLPLIPGAMAAVEAGRLAGAAVVLAGAGPGLLAFAPDQHHAIAHAMQQGFRSADIDSDAYFLSTQMIGSSLTSA
ncbi:MAG: homoserine kinase [Anaerolineales bacterium]